MTSVRMNTNGQSSTPAVKFSVPDTPSRLHLNGSAPRVASRAKIFTPTSSASTAFVTKNAASARKSRPAREVASDTVGALVTSADAAQLAPLVLLGTTLRPR
jgi:hypothetical protein